MKKVLALIIVCFMLMMTLASCDLFGFDNVDCTEHVDANGDYVCDNCEAELEKPHTEHVDANEDYVCDECGEELERPEPPVENVPVKSIFVSTDDEDGEGTLENPYKVVLAQSQSIVLSYAVQPKDATDKTLTWSVIDAGTGITFEDNGTRLTILAAADATSALVKGEANDGSGVCVYISVVVESYTAVSNITSSTLLASEEEGYDYILKTALGTNWDMSAGILARGQELLDGKIFGGSQKPRNLVYFPTLRNFGIEVAPADATNKSILVSYSNEGIVRVDIDGSWTALAAGETIVTVSSYANPDVTMKVKVVVEDALYRGISKAEYDATAASLLSSWDLDADHNTAAQFQRYDDWHLVMIHTNSSRGQEGNDGNQKIFYMGQSDRPYGICLENHIAKSTGGSLTEAASLMWAKLTIPTNAQTFNVKIGNNDKVHGQYRVIWVAEDGTVLELTEGWIGFVNGPSESTVKLELPADIKGTTGAMVIEHRLTEYDNNAELQIKVMKFEGFNPVTSVQLAKAEGTYKPGQMFKLQAAVKPDNATNDKVVFFMAEGSADKGITVDETGLVTIGEGVANGEYIIVAAAAENTAIKAEFKLTVTADEIVPNKWEGKSDILNGLQGVKWTIVGETDAGVGEGADLKVTGNNKWSSLKLDGKKITANSFMLKFGARVFHRDGETYPKFVIKVNGEVVRGVGQSEDWFYVDTDATQYCSYDLSKWMGQKVTVEIGITQGTHAVVQYIEFFGTDAAREWANKSELQDANGDPWKHEGNVDAGVGEGYDIRGTGSYIYNSFLIGAGYNSQFTFGARVFHRNGETYPDIAVMVRDAAGNEHIIRAIGVDADSVHVDTDAIQHFTYDLSAFAGQEVTVAIGLMNNATHCVITDVKMEGNVPEYVEPKLEAVTEWNNKGELQDKALDPWQHKGNCDAGVGEGYDIRSTGSYIYNSFLITKGHNNYFTFGGRVFHRSGETYPEVYLVVVDEKGVEHRITAIGAANDYVYFDQDAIAHFTYDLSEFDGQRVEIRLVLKNDATHCVFTDIKMAGSAE